MEGYHIFTVLVMVTTLLLFINSRFIKWPATIAVTVFSLIISVSVILLEKYLPHLNRVITKSLLRIEFDQIVMHILLGFLLFGAAFKTNAQQFIKHLKPIITMAIISTLISIFIVGSLMYYVFILLHHQLPYLECLLFGALISPTDPIAAIGVLKKVGIPKNIELQITGESLVNDGIAIVAFTTLLGIAASPGSDYNVSEVLLLFVRETGGAIVFGGLLGGFAYLLLKLTGNAKVEIMITLSIVMGGYSLGEMLHISSPIAMVVAGLICSVPDNVVKTHISEKIVFYFWDLIEEFINVVLFLLIGIGVFVIPFNTSIFIIGFICIVILLVARYNSILPVVSLLKSHFKSKSIYLLTWAALRGAVSIALALAIPAALHRTEFLSITYIIAVFTIIVQGLTIKTFAEKLGINS